MLRDVFYYGKKPNVHPRERFAKDLADARNQSTTQDFWIINEFCDYTNFDWDFDFDFLPDEDVWAQDHNNVWPSIYQKDSGTWLCNKSPSEVIVYRNDVSPLKRNKERSTNWVVHHKIDEHKFDFGWHPDPSSPPYIYVWGNQWVSGKTAPTIEYKVPGATTVKHMDTIAFVVADMSKWNILEPVDINSFDFSWMPDPSAPPYIYVWGNQWNNAEDKVSLKYVVEGATEYKYMSAKVKRLADTTNWHIPNDVDVSRFDFSWEPNPHEPKYIYQFGTQWQRTGGPRYITPGSDENTPVKYIDKKTLRAKKLPDKSNWSIPSYIDEDSFDFSWHPDDTSPAYLYHFGTQWNDRGGPTYIVENATETNYVQDIIAKTKSNLDNWEIPDNIDKDSFDFSWVPHPDDPPYIYQFGTQWQKTNGPRYVVRGASEVKYVNVIKAVRLSDMSRWQIPDNIDVKNFDFSWHPDETEPDYIYEFGTQWQKTGGPRYIPPSITVLGNKKALGEYKYVDAQKAIKLPEPDKFTTLVNNKILDFDYSWHPDETEPPYIYQFGNDQYHAEIMPTIEYHVPTATTIKYVEDVLAKLGPSLDNWVIPDNVDVENFDFSWLPNPKDPAYIYQFGTQWQKTGGPRYVVPGATEYKYIDTVVVKALPTKKNWKIPDNVDVSDFDFSWHPDPLSPPYIYHFGTQWQETGGPVYHVEGATQVKYVSDIKVKALPTKKNWTIPKEIDKTQFDFSWHPSALDDEPYIYQFGTQWQKTGGPRYTSPGATKFSPVKYVKDQKALRLANKKKFTILYGYKIEEFDYSWHPDDTDEPFIYVFGNNWWGAETMPTIEYHIKGATKRKYVNDVIAKLGQDKTFWLLPDNIDTTGFDFSWKPNPFEPAYIYKFGTQWQKTGGPEYWTPDASDVKYMDFQKVKALSNKKDKRWEIPDNVDVTDFDFSWHPDENDPPFIYQFGTQWANSGGPKFRMKDATEIKYVNEVKAKALPDKSNWVIPKDVDQDSFDFSWHPFSEDLPYIYVFGTQHQDTGGPRYVTPGAAQNAPMKYIDRTVLVSKRLPNPKRFSVLFDCKIKDFDFSWHPDERDDPYTYHFGSNHYAAEVMPAVEYRVAGAKSIKYVHEKKAILDVDMTNWIIPENVSVPDDFDFSWRPNPRDPEYIYEFGTQWQKTGGPRYVVEGATEIKYMEGKKALALPTVENWYVVDNIKIKDFDFSWHPDRTEEPYIYVFGNNLYPGEIMPTVKYIVSGATQVKYISDIKATLATSKNNWLIPEDVDVTGFDFSWIPNPLDPPYIYEFGTQWQKTGGPRYVVPGATETKYIDTFKVTRLPVKTDNWIVEDGIKIKDFDYSWHPDSTDDPYIYVFGNTLHPAEIMPTLKYVVPGASAVKYVHDIKATLGINMNNWIVSPHLDVKDFDFSWLPDPTSPPYIYEFGTQWQKTGGPKYVVKNAKDIKYVEGSKAKALPNINEHWREVDNISVVEFDYSWHPDNTEEAYIYVFGNTQYGPEKMPTLKYVMPGATQIKYVQEPRAKLKPSKKYWNLLLDVKLVDFDYSWVPDPNDPPYIYVFGNQWNTAEKEPTIEYRVPGATEIKYINDIRAVLAPSMKNWTVLYPIDETKFDFSWRPDPNDPPYIYIFGNQWNKAEVEQTVKYTISGATDKKFINNIMPMILPDMSRWVIPDNVNTDNFDFSWRPNPGAPPYIYQFGTIENDEDGPRYEHPDHRGEVVKLKRVEKEKEKEQAVSKYYITTTLEDLANEHTEELFWALNPDIDYSEFDFSWRPSIEQARYVHAFGSADNINTQTYFVNGPQWARGNRDINYVEDKDAKLKVIVDMFFVDKGNAESNDRFNRLKAKYGDKIQKTRYLNSWVDTINRCINRASTNLCWILNSELDYTNFNFDYYPNPWQAKMVHVFGTQWSHWGTTFMVNRETFPTDTKWIKIVEHLSNLNFVKDRKAKATNNLYDIVLIDHGNRETTSVKKMLEGKANGKSVTVVPYKDSYFNTLKTLVKGMNPKKEHYVWICSSICNYNSFDFSYICDPFAKDNLHVFATSRQKFGDTFLVDINKTLEIIDTIDTLQAYHKVNYSNQFSIHRLPAPVIYTEGDTHMSSIKEDFEFPYAVFMTEDVEVADTEPMSLWTEETKNILITSTGGTRIIVPREAKDFVKDQLYDYPYIKTASKLAGSKPLDIVFLSNGEKCAEENYEHLLAVTKGLKNRITRVDGVDGRVQAYHAALQASNTTWAFTVFAKLKVNPKFDWGWQPDRLQMPKHYIFHAKNPINGLEYGHQGMIAYNKKLTLANTGKGLDFTLDDPHETVAMLSGIATFNTDAYSTWRTAFREVIKLKSDYEDISQKRLEAWLNKAEGQYANDCLLGAKDAVEYYDSVSGDIDQLKLSYEWKWLKDYYNKKYK